MSDPSEPHYMPLPSPMRFVDQNFLLIFGSAEHVLLRAYILHDALVKHACLRPKGILLTPF